jgi:phosphinothricin acetyltransferase
VSDLTAGKAGGAIRGVAPADAEQICAIYNHHVRHTIVTFEETPVTAAEMAARIADVTARWPWFVWAEGGSIGGYAYATEWKSRSAYRFSVESTVYVAPSFERRGIGTRLYEALIAQLRQQRIHCVVGGIALPNAASVALHEKLGFVKIGQFIEVGFKLDRFIDVGYWELILSSGSG